MAHLLTRRIVEPVEEPAARRRLADQLVDLETHAVEELLNLAHGLQLPALPAHEADCVRRCDWPILHPLHYRRRSCCALEESKVIVAQSLKQRLKMLCRDLRGDAPSPDAAP